MGQNDISRADVILAGLFQIQCRTLRFGFSKNWTLTQADKHNKLQACTKEELLLLLKNKTLLFFTNDSQTHHIAAKTLSTQY